MKKYFASCLVGLLAFASQAQAGEAVLYSFTGMIGVDGGAPAGHVAMDHGGRIYGASGTPEGTADIFALTPPAAGQSAWTAAPLYEFPAYSGDGVAPEGGVTLAQDGSLYGSTHGGGSAGLGTVYKLSPPSVGQTGWTETLLHDCLYGQAANPQARPILDPSGALYGTSTVGGSDFTGSVYKLRPPAAGQSAWTYSTLFSFPSDASGGIQPDGALLLGPNGVLYGTTYAGQHYGSGVVFALIPPSGTQTAWTEQLLHVFTGGPDGQGPVTAVIGDSSGNLYGTTLYGGGGSPGYGTVYEVSPPAAGRSAWTETVLFRFGLNGNGYNPQTDLYRDSSGNLYGTTSGGRGTVFELSPPAPGQSAWTIATFSFNGPNGRSPLSNLVPNGKAALLGTTSSGGAFSLGTLFRISH